MYLSKSKYCSGLQCKKILWLDKYQKEVKEEVNNTNVLQNGTSVGEVAKNLFKDHKDISFNEDLRVMVQDTDKLLKEDSVIITEASFIYENNFCSIDILKKNKDEYEIIEVKSSTEIKDIYVDDVSYQTFILLNNGLNVKKVFIAYINNKYIRQEQLDLKELFNLKDVTDIVFKKQEEIKKNINEMNEYLENKELPEEQIGMHCMMPYECPYFNFCTRHLPSNNVFKIRNMKANKKFTLYEKGIVSYEDLLKTDISDSFKMQIIYELEDKEDYIDKQALKSFLDTLSYPLYFLDFETFQDSIPKFCGTKPYEQIPFQYSLHYLESEDSPLLHKEFLAENECDPRRDLALSLISAIPKDSCILAYNMKFEKMIIANLALIFPDLKEHLMNIYDNIKDLMYPFQNKYYYTKNMQGSFSIKYVLPALFPNDLDLDYHNLDLVHNGTEAMASYQKLNKLDEYDKQKLRSSLLEYCKLDTYAMVKIYEKLKEVTK